MIDKDKLLADLRYSSKYNKPCPEWVYHKIKAMEDMEPCEDTIDRYAALAILHPASVEYKEMKALPSVQPKKAVESGEVNRMDAIINRQDVIEAIDKDIMGGLNYKRILKNLPSAQPETAKRIVGKSKGGVTLWYECDMCKESVDVQDNFCRGCGRRLTDE